MLSANRLLFDLKAEIRTASKNETSVIITRSSAIPSVQRAGWSFRHRQMAKNQAFDFKPTARLEQVDGKHSERVKDRKRRSQ